MPKLKSNRGAAKRFRATASGKFKRKKSYLRHFLTRKNRKRKRNLRQSTLVSKADMGRVRRMLPTA